MQPLEFLQGLTNAPVEVKLHLGSGYRGQLKSIDGFMNVVLGGSVVESMGGVEVETFTDEVFIRGNNVLFIARA